MSDPTNDVLQDLRNCMKNEPPPYFIELLRRAADEIERLLRGEFTEYELALAGLTREESIDATTKESEE